MLIPACILLAAPLFAAQADTPQAADAAYERKDYATCGAMYARLGRQKNDRTLLYNAVCCFALAGEKDDAFALLGELVRTGFTNTRQLREDADLASLRDDRRWNELLLQAEANWRKVFGDTNPELWSIRESDDADRQSADVDLEAARTRDRARLARVKEIMATVGLKSASDHFIAAMVHQHGSTPDDYLQARALAQRAAELDPQNLRAKWLVAAAQDRYLRSIGKPQIYGTQFAKVDGVWRLEPIDETAVTDEERAQWNVPPLAEAKRRAEEMNKKK